MDFKVCKGIKKGYQNDFNGSTGILKNFKGFKDILLDFKGFKGLSVIWMVFEVILGTSLEFKGFKGF